MTKLLTWCGTTSPRDIGVPDEKKDPLEIFRRIENVNSSISVVYDKDKGNVWLIDKPSDESNYRCETNGIKLNESPWSSYEDWNEGDIYDFSWSSKLPETNDNSEFGDYVIFQWKSAPPQTQNYPFLLRVLGNKIDLIHSNFEGKWLIIWSGVFEFEQWFDVKIRIRLSRDKDKGKLHFYYGGQRQDFICDQNGDKTQAINEFTGRTLDDSANYVKWGVYNRDMPGHALKHYVDRLFIKQIA